MLKSRAQNSDMPLSITANGLICLGLKMKFSFWNHTGNGWRRFLSSGTNKRDARWTESIAVGDQELVSATKNKLGQRQWAGKYMGKTMTMN